jgi:3-oxoadipate enol-lactonase/4-carboxymuconolactone decarboxylase
VLDALGIVQAHIGGISIGGMVAQQFAAQYPDRALSLILCDTALAIPPASSWYERVLLVREKGIGVIEDTVIARWVTPAFMDAPETQGLRAMLRRTTTDGYAGCAAAIAAADLAVSTAKLSLPVLVMVGGQDLATPVEAAMELYDALFSNGSLPHEIVVISDAAHIPTVEKPDHVTNAILNFFKLQNDDIYEMGLAVRNQVLGAAHVARATAAITDFDRDFQQFITETAWGQVWTRPGLDRRTRSLLTLAITAALGREEEFSLHVRASKNTGTSRADISETLLHTAIYAGVPAANAAFRAAKAIFKEQGA